MSCEFFELDLLDFFLLRRFCLAARYVWFNVFLLGFVLLLKMSSYASWIFASLECYWLFGGGVRWVKKKQILGLEI